MTEPNADGDVDLRPPPSLRVELRGAVGIVWLDRPAKRNALNDETVIGLERCLRGLATEVRAAVLAPTAGHFSAGLDLTELEEASTFEGAMRSRLWHETLGDIEFGTIPVVSALQGAVIGGGLELACATHIRVADATAFYALPEAQHGIFVGGGGSVRLPRLIGTAAMMDMMLTGRVLTAEEGHRAGLSHYLVDAGQAVEKAIELAERIAGNPPMTNFAVLQALPRIARAHPDEGYLMEALMAGIAQSGDDQKTRLRAFLDGRTRKVRLPGGEDAGPGTVL